MLIAYFHFEPPVLIAVAKSKMYPQSFRAAGFVCVKFFLYTVTKCFQSSFRNFWKLKKTIKIIRT